MALNDVIQDAFSKITACHSQTFGSRYGISFTLEDAYQPCPCGPMAYLTLKYITSNIRTCELVYGVYLELVYVKCIENWFKGGGVAVGPAPLAQRSQQSQEINTDRALIMAALPCCLADLDRVQVDARDVNISGECVQFKIDVNFEVTCYTC